MSGESTKDMVRHRSDFGAAGDHESLREVHPHRMDTDVILRIVKAIHAHEGEKLGWRDVERTSGTIVRGGFPRQALMAPAEIYEAYMKRTLRWAVHGRWRQR